MLVVTVEKNSNLCGYCHFRRFSKEKKIMNKLFAILYSNYVKINEFLNAKICFMLIFTSLHPYFRFFQNKITRKIKFIKNIIEIALFASSFYLLAALKSSLSYKNSYFREKYPAYSSRRYCFTFDDFQFFRAKFFKSEKN